MSSTYGMDMKPFVRKLSEVSEPLLDQYGKVPTQGKFVTGMLVGMTSARFTIKTATRAFKLITAGFFITEVMYASRLIRDDILTEENEEMLNGAQAKLLSGIERMRTLVENTVSMEKLRKYVATAVEKDSTSSGGFAVGAALGLLIF
eukprot:CAMPEP_0178969358 /NCGR_PEP_ID=MMETSP0789-20121207/18812_1 /TAXON_ID=3005 /ORGANISM="Rhizosolenia setigera, Strain CCMP 1694" /LENGTH=146 /DNA_ID=CAMNT_0020655483 /DNA_START=118 /DNA_END=558 /DNA_ORIENTATION=+